MSWQNWSEQGYGFQLFNGKNDRQVLDFIRSNSKCKISDIDAEDLLSGDASYMDICDNSASVIIAGIINSREKYSVFVGYIECGNTGQEEMIGVCPGYPWLMNRRDKELTLEKADSILKKYADILGITEEPEFFDAYYAG